MEAGLDASPPVADATRAVRETLVRVAIALRAGCSGPNSRLAFAAGVSACGAFAVKPELDAAVRTEEPVGTDGIEAGVVFRAANPPRDGAA